MQVCTQKMNVLCSSQIQNRSEVFMHTVLRFHTVPFYPKGYLVAGGLSDAPISRVVKSSA